MCARLQQIRLSTWLDHELPLHFESRILPIDRAIADACGKLVASSKAAGRTMEAVDAFLAATGEVHRLTVVTRNVAHFQPTVKALMNPWS